jgi:hypothetical protein
MRRTPGARPRAVLPLAHGIPGSEKELVARADEKRPGELAIPGREIARRCANLAVGQLGASGVRQRAPTPLIWQDGVSGARSVVSAASVVSSGTIVYSTIVTATLPAPQVEPSTDCPQARGQA